MAEDVNIDAKLPVVQEYLSTRPENPHSKFWMSEHLPTPAKSALTSEIEWHQAKKEEVFVALIFQASFTGYYHCGEFDSWLLFQTCGLVPY